MNSFLGNLIDRHQSGSHHREMGYKVQPRPKARFETEPVTTSALDNDPSNDDGIAQRTKTDSETGSLLTQGHSVPVETLTTDKTPSSRNQSPLETHESPDKKSVNPIDNYRVDDINERIKAISVKLGRKQSAQEEERNSAGDQHVQGTEAIPNLKAGPEKVTDSHFSLEGELNNRIQEILQRLQNRQTTQTENKSRLEHPREPIIADSNHKEITKPADFHIQPEIEPEGSIRAITVKSQTDNSQSDNRILQQPGLLQIPNWLTAIQADLNNRWQEINTKADSEPVVNVTIGRVEVRAVQTDSAKQPKTRNKPSGVMSLDDYLKRREHRGQA